MSSDAHPSLPRPVIEAVFSIIEAAATTPEEVSLRSGLRSASASQTDHLKLRTAKEWMLANARTILCTDWGGRLGKGERNALLGTLGGSTWSDLAALLVASDLGADIASCDPACHTLTAPGWVWLRAAALHQQSPSIDSIGWGCSSVWPLPQSLATIPVAPRVLQPAALAIIARTGPSPVRAATCEDCIALIARHRIPEGLAFSDLLRCNALAALAFALRQPAVFHAAFAAMAISAARSPAWNGAVGRGVCQLVRSDHGAVASSGVLHALITEAQGDWNGSNPDDSVAGEAAVLTHLGFRPALEASRRIPVFIIPTEIQVVFSAILRIKRVAHIKIILPGK